MGGGVKALEGGQAGEAVNSNVKALRPVFIKGRVQIKPMSRLLIGLIFYHVIKDKQGPISLK